MIRKLSAFFLLMVVALIATNIYAEDIMDKLKDGYKITIMTTGTTAPLCPRPMCGMNEHIARIPEDTVLKVDYSAKLEHGATKPVVWCYVNYEGKRGWVSVYDTDQKSTRVTKGPNSTLLDKPRSHN